MDGQQILRASSLQLQIDPLYHDITMKKPEILTCSIMVQIFYQNTPQAFMPLWHLFIYFCVCVSKCESSAHVFVFIVSNTQKGTDHLSNHEMQNQVIHEQNRAWASHDEWMNSLFHRMFQLLRTINTSWRRLYVLAATYDFPLSEKARFLSLVMRKG